MEQLFRKNINFQDDVYRNIVSLRKSEDLFDDINDHDEVLSSIAKLIESNVKKDIPYGFINRGFHYTTAIAYPFETDSFMASRYSDGTFGVWYGSLSLETTIFETVYHMFLDETKVEGIHENIYRERAIYKIACQATLIDLTNAYKDYPQLISDNYDYTQQIGRKIHREGHPGLLVPSARHPGINTVIFNSNILSNPRNFCYLTYIFNPTRNEIVVERQKGHTLHKISKEYFSQPHVRSSS